MKTTFSAALLIVVSACACLAQASYQMSRYSINSGGGLVSGGAYRLNSSLGQSTAGFVENTNFLHWVGFWAGEVPTPTVAPTVSDAKLWPDGMFVSIAAKIATSDASGFGDFFYIEEETRASGIRVSTPGGPIASLARGNRVNVIGTLGTTPAGERELTGPIVVIVSSRDPLLPLGMTNRGVGGGDLGDPAAGLGQYGVADGTGLNNIGLLIKSWGRVIETGKDYIVMDDGSSTPVRVSTAGMSKLPGVDDYITVVGISSIYKPGADRLRLVLPRTRGDID